MERPWQREFKQKPLEMIARDRAKYIAAALTIPLAFIAEGQPDQPPELNGFAHGPRCQADFGTGTKRAKRNDRLTDGLTQQVGRQNTVEIVQRDQWAAT